MPPVRAHLLLIVVLGLTACGGGERPYAEVLQTDRLAKDQAFLASPDSPVPPADRARLVPLGYYAIDEGYRVPAVLTPYEGEPAVEMPTSTGKRRDMRRAGQLKFYVKGHSLTLTAFVDAEDRAMARLFVPFADQTNGSETYAAGRYLDLDRTATTLYDLDFNRAYHPYCFYNPQYDCPYPPRENRLAVPIRSGERIKP